jgi:uncharacterized protein
MEQILKIADFILDSFIHIWPYLLITIPLAVVVQISGAAKFINKAFSKNPMVSVLLATIVGAFSPFCSCGVIPVIVSLLIGGVPLAPVMSFWIASPSMDPEIFFLSTASIGWNLSIWRLVATFFISLSAGFITHLLFKKGMLGQEILRNPGNNFSSEENKLENKDKCLCDSLQIKVPSLQRRILTETWKAVIMVCKFMTLAFFINALINFYVPQQLVAELLGGKSSTSVFVAALVGIPVYTSNITALPLISGLISLGMNKGAALTFLIAGPMTTLPAMSAVWGIVKVRVFMLYLSFSLLGSILFGLLFNLIN